MALVKNTHSKTPIGLPDGSVVPPRGELDVPQWADYRDRQNLAFYVESGVLVVERDNELTALSKEELLARLKALGIDAAGNSKTETLQKKLDEALAAAEKQKVMDELTTLNVEFDKEASLEDLQAALATAKA